MNKPAPKEPSMDEILSSIRQIIADDDAAGVSRKPAIQAAPPPMQAAPATRPAPESADEAQNLTDILDEIEPLALSASQIVGEQEEAADEVSFDAILADTAEEEDAPLVDPEDITFEPAAQDAPEAPGAIQPEEIPQPAPAAEAKSSGTPSLPDPTLSSDMADELLEPATNAAVRSTFARLNNIGLGTQGLTIETMVRDMLRPMLKEWLDENLPSVVERMVEREIARISRGE